MPRVRRARLPEVRPVARRAGALPGLLVDRRPGHARTGRCGVSLHVLDDLVQRSDEWYEARRGMVTASVVGRLITPAKLEVAANEGSRALTAVLVAERVTGFVDPTWKSLDMWRGAEEEPLAAEVYSEHYAPVTTCGFMSRDDWGFSIGYSPDGLVGDDGLIEVKCPRSKGHLLTILADEVPPEYMAQMQAALLVSGRDWCDYVSYCGGCRCGPSG